MWSREAEGDHIWGVEYSGSLGKGFAQFLPAQGESSVYEVSPRRTAQYRRRGRKADALAIARLLVAESGDLPAVRPDDLSTELRLLSDHRDNLLAERTRLLNRLHAQMLQIDPGYKDKSGPLTKKEAILYCRGLQLPDSSSLLQIRRLIVRQLCDQALRIDDEIAELGRAIGQKVRESDTPLVQMSGVGQIVAARLIGELGSSPRIPSAGALTSLAGIAPVDVSSAGTGDSGSTSVATESSTARSTSSRLSSCAVTRSRKPTTPGNAPRARPAARPCAASSASSST